MINGAKGLAGNLPGQIHYGIQGPPGPQGNTGNPGGYYTPSVTQLSEETLQFEFTPSKSDMPTVKPITVELPTPDSGGNADQVSIEPAEDDIPKIFFGGALQQTKDEKIVSFRYISKTDDFSGYAEIKAQGNSSMSYPKKNQTVKLYQDAECTEKLKVDFKGWGKQSKHVYKANWIDLTHARNVVSARLWGDVVTSRANYEELPELLRTSPNQGAVDGFPVKVYAAGVYQGRYTLNIPKDKWMANMDDELDIHCILCGEGYNSGCFRSVSTAEWTDEIHDSMPTTISNRWKEIITFVMNSTDEDFRANLGNYFDIPSLIDYYLFALASCGLDAMGKNQLYLTYDGQKWIASMYDMDSTWGLYWNGSKFVATDYARTSYEDFVSGRQGNLLYIRLEQLFWSELQTRWAELKNGALSIVNIINRFERFTDIAPAELVKEDYASTTGGGEFTGIPSQTTNNIQQIRAFALARQVWTDEYVAGLTPEVEVPCTGITLSASELTFTAEGSQTLTATVTPDGCTDPVTWESDNTSVATVSGGVVTAIENGSANITAKCGKYSASCSVSVSGIAVEPDEPESGLLYSLPEATTFDGVDDYIDTGIQLFDTPKDFTLLIRANFAEANTTSASVFHCMKEVSPWPGLNIKCTGTNTAEINVSSTAIATVNTSGLAVTVKQGAVSNVWIFSVDGMTEMPVTAGTSYVSFSKNLLLGCYQDDTGTKGRYWKGTIYDFKVWNAVLTSEEIEEKLNVLSCSTLYSNYSPSGVRFGTTAVVDFDMGSYIEAEIDLSGCTGTLENILSIGKYISAWPGENIHLYYTAGNETVSIQVDSSGGSSYEVPISSNVIAIRFDKNGLTFNGMHITADNFTTPSAFTSVVNTVLGMKVTGIGSCEGSVRSNATYNYIRVGVDA